MGRDEWRRSGGERGKRKKGGEEKGERGDQPKILLFTVEQDRFEDGLARCKSHLFTYALNGDPIIRA